MIPSGWERDALPWPEFSPAVVSASGLNSARFGKIPGHALFFCINFHPMLDKHIRIGYSLSINL